MKLDTAKIGTACADANRLQLLAELERRYATLKAEYLEVSANMTDMPLALGESVGRALVLHARMDEVIWAMQLITLCATCQMKGEC